MNEFATLERCAAYAAARATLDALQQISCGWPDGLAQRARLACIDTIELTAAALSHRHGSIARRGRLRDALTSAIDVAGLVDLARAMGFVTGELDESQRLAGRTIALLGMFLQANTMPVPGMV